MQQRITQAQQFTGTFLSLSHSMPKMANPRARPAKTARTTQPLQVMISIMVAMCSKEYIKMQKNPKIISPELCSRSISSSFQLITLPLSLSSRVDLYVFLKSFLVILLLTAGSATESMLAKTDRANPNTNNPAQSQSTVQLHLFKNYLWKMKAMSQFHAMDICITLPSMSPQSIDNNIMERDQTKLVTRCEIKKQRVAYYPFFIISGTYDTPDLSFIIAADYSSDCAVLYVYPLRNDMTKLITSTIPLTDIMPRKIIATIHVTSLVIRPATASVSIQAAEFIIGYRSGQMIVVEYKDKECKVKHRFNKTLKNEGFFSRASSAIFGGQDTYAAHIKGPIRHFSIHPEIPECAYVWQAGNSIVLQRELNQNRQNRFFTRVETLELQNYHLNYDINKLVKESDVYLFGCDFYTMVEHPQLGSSMVVFKDQVSSFVILGARRELVVSLSSKEIVLILDMTHFLLKQIIRPEMPVRKLTSFSHKGQPYLALLPYENYIVLYSLATNTYCKLRGHKSFISNVAYSQKGEKLITAGMDHQICIIKLQAILQASWLAAKPGDKCRTIKEYGIPDQKFLDTYKLGDSGSNNSTTRTNAYSYGFADIYPLNGHFCFPTYDCRIIIYSL